MLTSIKTKL